MNDVTVLVISMVLAGLLGFAAHRASICTVRAVAEVVSTRRATMFLGFLKTSLWVIASTVPLMWLLRLHTMDSVWGVSWLTLAGGFSFGMGAALNKGCAFSLLARLADGQVSMLLAVAGIGLGAFGYVKATDGLALASSQSLTSPYLSLGPWLPVLVALVWVWAVRELVRLWRSRPAGMPVLRLLLAERYRLSTAALIMGLSNGILYTLHGPWAYTSAIPVEAGRLAGREIESDALLGVLVVAVLLGMVLSAWQRGSFRLEWRPSSSWILNLAGGALMGMGAAMAHGGNDVLILHGIPGLSPHALPTYLAMVAGIALPVGLMSWWQGEPMRIDCAGDVCRTDLSTRIEKDSAAGPRPICESRAARPIGGSHEERLA